MLLFSGMIASVDQCQSGWTIHQAARRDLDIDQRLTNRTTVSLPRLCYGHAAFTHCRYSASHLSWRCW